MMNEKPSSPSQEASPETVTPPTYAEKTDRIRSWVDVIKSIAPILWAIVFFAVIIPLFGQFFLTRAFSNPTAATDTKPPVVAIEKQFIDWNQIDEAMALALVNAHQSAESYAAEKIDTWIDELMERVDSRFLDWYFGYFNQKERDYKSLFVQLSSGAAHWLNPDKPSSAEKVAEVITADFQREFAKRVLHPQIAQLRLERTTQQTVQNYLEALQGNINTISATYQIPQADWNRYLSDIAIAINDEGNLSTLSLKVLAGGGAYLAVKPLVAPLVAKVGTKMVTKLASKTGAKIATKTGASLAGKLGAGLLDTTVGVGIILWDIWDTHHTAQVEKPILRDTIANYLQEVKYSLLENSENSIMAAVEDIEVKLMTELESRSSLES